MENGHEVVDLGTYSLEPSTIPTTLGRGSGTQLGVSPVTAYHDVQDELGRLDAVVGKKAERLRDLEARQCDVLQLAPNASAASRPASIPVTHRLRIFV